MTKLRTFLMRLTFKKGGLLFGLGSSVESYWKVVLIFTASLIALIIGFSVFMFIKINKGEIFVTERSRENGKDALDLNILKETVSYYQKKALEFERIQNERASSTDPSL